MYTLLIITAIYGGLTFNSVPGFTTLQACNVAGAQAIAIANKQRTGYLEATCVKVNAS